MEIVTGFQGKNHVTARQISRLLSGLSTGGEVCVLQTLDQLPAEVLTANTVRVGTGDIVADGCYFTAESPEELTIENGVTGLNRNDLIVCRYRKADPAVDEDGNPDYTIPRIESGELAVVKGVPSSGTPTDPTTVEASIYDDNTALAEFPLYRLPIRGLSVGAPEPLFKKLTPGQELCDSISQIVEKAQAAVENALAPVALSANINTTSCTCAFNAKRLGRLVIVSGTIMPKTTGAGLRLLEVIGGRATTMAYGAAVQYNGPSGKVYAVAGSSGTTYLNFDIPAYGVNYNFSISYWV